LVLPKNQISAWIELTRLHQFNIPIQIAEGGDTRFQSVKNGLAQLKEECIVGIHDGVRPLVSHATLNRCYKLAQKTGSAIPVTDAIESIRKVSDNANYAVDRKEYKMVQTPQVFLYSAIKKTYEQPFKTTFTDDASVYESAGYTVSLTEGNRENIKVTTPMDLIIGEALILSSSTNE
jgi:2-C-methyl-D-erythritol 4-phosphate cytidylyltransferase